MQNAAIEAMKAKDEQQRREMETLRATMKGKQYAYDHAGNVVLLNTIDPQRLPKPMLAPNFRPCTPGHEHRRRGKGAAGAPSSLALFFIALVPPSLHHARSLLLFLPCSCCSLLLLFLPCSCWLFCSAACPPAGNEADSIACFLRSSLNREGPSSPGAVGSAHARVHCVVPGH